MACETFVQLGGEYRHVEGHGLVCVNPGRVTYRSSWPEDARQEIGVLRAALKRIVDGDGDGRALQGRLWARIRAGNNEGAAGWRGLER